LVRLLQREHVDISPKIIRERLGISHSTR
jgi:hypothetical protein